MNDHYLAWFWKMKVKGVPEDEVHFARTELGAGGHAGRARIVRWVLADLAAGALIAPLVVAAKAVAVVVLVVLVFTA